MTEYRDSTLDSTRGRYSEAEERWVSGERRKWVRGREAEWKEKTDWEERGGGREGDGERWVSKEEGMIWERRWRVEGGEGERREEWGEVSGFYINRLINSKSPKTLSTQQPTKMMGGRRRTAGRRVGIRGGNGL